VTVAVVMPWRGGDPERERHHTAVRSYLRQLLPHAVHLDADSGHQPFSRDGTRNYGVRLAERHAADVVVLCDADTLVEAAPLHAAINAAPDGVLHLPFTRYRGLSRAGTRGFTFSGMKDPYAHPTEDETTWSTGGVLVIQPAAWWRAGGMDERFQGWGGEDPAFAIAAGAILGPVVRHEGTIHHLWHPATRLRDPSYAANMALGRRYDAAEGDACAVRVIVAEHSPATLAIGP
jgi:hypothetical protein